MEYNSLQEKNEQVLNDIAQLQIMEQDLYTQLTVPFNSLSVQQKEQIILKINEISQMRINLYKTLIKSNSYYENNLSTASDTLNEQTVALRIVEEQMNESKKRLDYINNQKLNKMREVEINNYYGSWYDERTQILKYVCLLLFIVIIFYILKKTDILPSGLFSIILIIIFLVGIYLILPILVRMVNRSNMIYSEYEWTFDKSKAPVIAGDTSNKNNNPWGNLGSLVCIGEQCCSEGNIYNPTLNQCVPSSK